MAPVRRRRTRSGRRRRRRGTGASRGREVARSLSQLFKQALLAEDRNKFVLENTLVPLPLDWAATPQSTAFALTATGRGTVGTPERPVRLLSSTNAATAPSPTTPATFSTSMNGAGELDPCGGHFQRKQT